MNAIRLRAVNRAFDSLDVSKDRMVSKDEMARVFDTERHPEVLRREKTADDVLSELLNAFDRSGDGLVSLEEFVQFYEGVSSGIADDGDFHTLVVRTWQLDQPTRPDRDLLRGAVSQGFRSSAFREHGLPAAETALCGGVAIERAALSLDPRPMPKAGVAPKGARSFYEEPAKTHHRVRLAASTALTVPAPDEHSSFGSTGRPGSLGFLNTQSTTQRSAGQGTFDADVVEAYEKGRAAEKAAIARRHELQQQPFHTVEPPIYARSSQTHAALGSAVNRDRPARPCSDRGAAGPSDSELRAVLEQQRADLRQQVTIGRAKCAPYKSTTQDHFGAMDTVAATTASDRFAVLPYRQQGDVAEVPQPQGRNGWETEYSTTMLDRLHEAERTTKHDAKGTFRLINGVSQMSAASHHPRNVVAGNSSPTDVVPHHFNSTTRATYL